MFHRVFNSIDDVQTVFMPLQPVGRWKNELYHSLLLEVIMLYKYWDGLAEYVQQGWWFKPHSCRTM